MSISRSRWGAMALFVGGLFGIAPVQASNPESTVVSTTVVSTTVVSPTTSPGTRPEPSRIVNVQVNVEPKTARVVFIRSTSVNSNGDTADVSPQLVVGTGRSVLSLPSGAYSMVMSAAGFQTVTEGVIVPSTAQVKISRRLDPIGQLHRHLWDAKTGSNPKQVTFTPDSKELWVPLLGSRGVDVFRALDGTKITTVTLGNSHGAVEVIFNRSGTRAYVSQMQTASVFEVDTSTKRVLRQMSTGGNWTKVLALSPDEATLYAANWVSNDVSVIRLATGSVVRRITTVKTPRGLVLDAKGERLFIAGFEGGEIQRITLGVDAATDSKKTLFRTGGAMRHMVADLPANRLYADDMGTNTTYVVDLETETVSLLGRVDSHPNTIDLSADARYLYVSNRGANNAKGYNLPGPEWGSVLVLDALSGKPVDAVIGGNQTTGLDVSPDGKLLAFTDFLDNRLAVYRIPDTATLASSEGGLAPNRRALIAK
jgi:YVTN family beta-propeller protein